MIRLWLSRDPAVSIHKQLSAQLMLGILSRRLPPGERLPSVRSLARRLRIHPNTVSAVYRELSERGWLHTRHGSGVFVREADARHDAGGLTAFVREWLRAARDRGFPVEALHDELARIETRRDVRSVVVVDPDPQLARIIATEVAERIGREVGSAGCDPAGATQIASASHVVVNAGNLPRIAPALGGRSFLPVRIKSMQDVVSGQTRPAAPVLIGIVSRSESIRAWAATLLSALGFPSESVLFRDPSRAGWRDGLGACDILAADLPSAAEMHAPLRPVVFRIVTDESLDEIAAAL